MFAALEPRQALFATLGSACVVNGVMLAGARPPAVRWRAAGTALAFGVPGFLLGAAVVGGISRERLQVAVGVAVVLAVLARAWHPGVIGPGPRRTAARATAGLTAGVLTTTVSANGPPIAIWMDAEGASPREFRDTLQVVFGAFNLAGMAALATHELPRAHTLAVTALLLPGLLVGLRAGRRLAPRLTPDAARRLALAVVGVTGVASIVAGLL